ncbi:MAG: CsgG/HfaB family protein [Pseudomonadota bacterium]
MSRILYPSILMLALTSSACMAGLVNEEFRRMADEIKARPPQLEVLDMSQLASVKRVAVMPFRNLAFGTEGPMEVYRGDGLMAGRVFFAHNGIEELIAERFEELLLKDRAVEVVERCRIAAVLHEQELAQSGVVKSEMMPEMVAASAGADAVLLGTITMEMIYMPDSPDLMSMGMFAIHVRLVDARDGKILAFGRDSFSNVERNINDEQMISELSARLAASLSAAIAEAHKTYPEAVRPAAMPYMQAPVAVPETSKGP